MKQGGTGRPGRPAAASREDVLDAAVARFLACERVDMQGLARELGLARATMHRWFGTREELIGEAIAGLAERRLRARRREIGTRGANALIECFDRFNQELVGSPGLRAFLAQEQERALRILTSSGGIVHPRLVAAVRELIDEEADASDLRPAVSSDALAFAIVRLAESFLYNDALYGIRGETVRLREVEAALLGGGPGRATR
jgi:AcrR family transcriptional regulator